GRSFPALLQGEDDKTDLALLKINATNDQPFPYVQFGDSTLARVGDWVLAIGNPFGLGGTTTSGIISARGRNINSGPYDDYIQVDAPINRGNSGGPLFNTKGEVIGVNTAIFSPNGGNIGIGFAIPANVVTDIVAHLESHGEMRRAWLGIQIQSVTPAIAESFNHNETSGVLVSAVNPNGPAARAGIEIGDIIMSFNDIATHRPRQLQHQVVRTPPGTEVDLVVWRETQNLRLTATVTLMPADMNVASSVPALTEKLERWGIELTSIDDDARRQHQIDASTKGVLIQHVATNSPGERKGLQAGDVIVRIGRTVVITPADVITQIARARDTGQRAMVFLILRQHATRFVPFNLA
ncbi:MAG: PDZ domain-containing protein, partial [Arenicellales bacterium]|nr:PDZ domain-containing protein [Arenicellales bacterium]